MHAMQARHAKKYRFLQEATANKRAVKLGLHERSLTLNKLRESEWRGMKLFLI